MHNIYLHLSSLVGLFVFLSQLMRYAPIDRTILTGVSSGLVVYVVLTLAGVIVRRIIAQGDAHESEGAASGARTGKGKDTEPAPAT